MRFAGSAPVTDFLSKSVNMGSVAQKAAENRSQLKNAGTQLQGQVGAAGINAAGEVEAAGIIGAAQSSLASAQGNAAIMSGIGDIAGAAIGTFGKSDPWSNLDTSNSYSGTGREKYGSFQDPTDSINSYLSTSDFFKR